MTTPRPGQRIRGRWVVLGVILWLILASSITLEQGQETAAQWGSAAALIVIGLVVLLAVGRVALIPLRAIGRRVRRRADRAVPMRLLTRDLAAVAGLAAAVVVSLVIVRVTASEPEPTTTASPRASTADVARWSDASAPIRGSSSPAASPSAPMTTTTQVAAPQQQASLTLVLSSGVPVNPRARPHTPDRPPGAYPNRDRCSDTSTGQPRPAGVPGSRGGRRRLAIGIVLVRLPRRAGRQHPPRRRLR